MLSIDDAVEYIYKIYYVSVKMFKNFLYRSLYINIWCAELWSWFEKHKLIFYESIPIVISKKWGISLATLKFIAHMAIIFKFDWFYFLKRRFVSYSLCSMFTFLCAYMKINTVHGRTQSTIFQGNYTCIRVVLFFYFFFI